MSEQFPGGRLPEAQRRWIEQQLHAAGIDPSVEEAVIRLVEALAACDLPADDLPVAVQVFADLARGRHIAPGRVDGPARWRAATPGRLCPGHRVRVLAGAFSGSVGELHNGREGVVVEVCSGDVIVRTTDAREPRLLSAHYSPHVLEVWQS